MRDGMEWKPEERPHSKPSSDLLDVMELEWKDSVKTAVENGGSTTAVENERKGRGMGAVEHDNILTETCGDFTYRHSAYE